MARPKLAAWPWPRWIAHRGAGKQAPENTLAAFRHGARQGWRAFECDVKLSRDGVAFLLHDATLERTTDGHGRAGDLDWAELSQRDAGSWHGRLHAGEPIPTLTSLTRWLRANGHLLNLEIKPTPGEEARTGAAVANQVAREWAGAAVPPLLSSFQPAALAAARQAQPELPRALLLDELHEGWLDGARQLGCVAVVFNHLLVDAALHRRCRAAGLRLACYTVNDPVEAQRLLALGVDALITDEVTRFAPAGDFA